MAPQTAILWPAIAMAFLTGFVWLRLGSDRLAELRARRIHPQQIANARDAAEKLQNVQSADLFRNLFEVPVLFYVVCAFFAITKLTTLFALACAWASWCCAPSTPTST